MAELTNSTDPTDPTDPTVPQTLFNVRGLTAVITGGSGVLGSIMALALAKAGVRVAILSLHAASSAKVVEAIQAEHYRPYSGRTVWYAGRFGKYTALAGQPGFGFRYRGGGTR